MLRKQIRVVNYEIRTEEARILRARRSHAAKEMKSGFKALLTVARHCMRCLAIGLEADRRLLEIWLNS